jgi:hypothetical protein
VFGAPVQVNWIYILQEADFILPVLRRPMAVFLLAGLALTGCGGGNTAPTGANSASAARNAHEVLIQAQRAVSHIKTFHVVGSIKQPAGYFNVNLHFAGPRGAYGSITYAGVSFNVVRIGPSIYFRAPANFYAKVGSFKGYSPRPCPGGWSGCLVRAR